MRTVRLTVVGLVLVLTALSAIAQAQSNQPLKDLTPAELTKILADPNASVFEKAKACQRLAVVGTKESIPALVALLPDEKLNCYARFALEAIPGPEVDAALREAAGKLQGRQLVGVLDSIGQRRDPHAVELLVQFLGDEDKAVAAAAAGALGRIGTPAAAKQLLEALNTAKPSQCAAIADACLLCAEQLAGDKEKQEREPAGKLYEALLNAEEGRVSRAARVGALHGLFRLDVLPKDKACEILLRQIRAPEEEYFRAGLAIARELPGAEVTAALATEMEKLPVERQALLLRAIGDRRESPPLTTIIKAAKSPDLEVRKAAIHVLSKRGDEISIATLLELALGEGEAGAAAKEGLLITPGKGVAELLLARLDTAAGRNKAVLLELVGKRQLAAALPVVRRALKDPEAAVRQAALTALGQLGELDDLEVFLKHAREAADKEERETALAALRIAALRMPDRDVCAAKLADFLAGAAPEEQNFLLTLLGEMSGPKALQIVVSAARSENAELKDSATRVLGEWVSAEAAPYLLEIAKEDAEAKYRIRALRGYIRIARQLQLTPEERLAMFREAMSLARRDEERSLALEVLSRIPSAETLSLAVSYLDRPGLKVKAAEVSVSIASRLLAEQPQQVAAAMQAVLDSGVGGEPAERAKRLLESAKAAKP